MKPFRQQLREAVIAHLKTVFGPEYVGDYARLLRDFQKSNLPYVAVVVEENVSKTDNQPAGYSVQRRDYNIVVRACAHEDDPDALATLDALSLRVETALVDGSVLNVGPLTDWRYAGTNYGEPQEMKDGLMLVSLSTFTTAVFTLDSDPSKNLHS